MTNQVIHQDQDQFTLDIPNVYAASFFVGSIFEVVQQKGSMIVFKRVYTEPKIVTEEPPALGVSVGDKVGTKERLG